MTDIGFAPKEVIPPQVCRLEILDADKADTYGLQIYLKLKVATLNDIAGSNTLVAYLPAERGLSAFGDVLVWPSSCCCCSGCSPAPQALNARTPKETSGPSICP